MRLFGYEIVFLLMREVTMKGSELMVLESSRSLRTIVRAAGQLGISNPQIVVTIRKCDK